MNYREATQNSSYRTLRGYKESELDFLWYCDFRDGPLNGLLCIEGRKYWFQMFEESGHPEFADFYRRFLIIELSQEQLWEEESWHTLFQKKVGFHTDYGRNKREELVRLKPRQLQEEFYELYRRRSPLSIDDNPVTGWVET